MPTSQESSSRPQHNLVLQHNQKILDLVDEHFRDVTEREIERRRVWQMEEEERLRRIRQSESHDVNQEQLKTELQEQFTSEIARIETAILEAQERIRRSRESGKIDPKLSDAHERVQQQFMRVINERKAARAEEKERHRRIKEEEMALRLEHEQELVESFHNLVQTLFMEEIARAERIGEDMSQDFHEAVMREVVRRQCWKEEEKERRRRVLEDVSADFQQTVLSEIDWEETHFMEEKERKRRMKEHSKKNSHEMRQLPSEVEAELISQVAKKEAVMGEEAERKRRMLEPLIEEAFESEQTRRITWVMEEQERRRRIFELLVEDYQDALERDLMREQVKQAEEAERARRIRMAKTGSMPDTLPDQKELMQEELLGKLSKEITRHEERAEQSRRVEEEKATIQQESEERDMTRKLGLLVVKRLEEKERERRVRRDLAPQFENALQSELERRRVWEAEEVERRRRITEANKTSISLAELENEWAMDDLHEEVSQEFMTFINKRKTKQLEERERERRITEPYLGSL